MAFIISMNVPLKQVSDNTRHSFAYIYCIVPESWVLSGSSGLTIHNKQRDIVLEKLNADIKDGDASLSAGTDELVHVVMDTKDGKYKGYWKRLLLDSKEQAKGMDRVFYASVDPAGEVKRYDHDVFMREVYERD